MVQCQKVVQAKLAHLKERLQNPLPRLAKGIDTEADKCESGDEGEQAQEQEIVQGDDTSDSESDE